MKAQELDEKFDNNEEDVLQYFDLTKIRRPGLETQELNIELPRWMLEKIDLEALRLQVNREVLIKLWVAERLDKLAELRNQRVLA